MNQSRTINLTAIAEDNHLEPVLKEKYTYDIKLKPRIVLKRHYFEQRQVLEGIYEAIFQKLNDSILNGIKAFVEKCLDTKEEHLFIGEEAECIFGATLNLNMQISDHEPTFNLIERHLKRYKNLHVTRIKVNSIRKRNLLDVLEPSRQSKRVFIMIEQAETLTRSVTDLLVGHLKNRIEDSTSPTSVIMLLFCLSTRMQEMSFDHVNCLGCMVTITKDRTSEDREVLSHLLRNDGMRMKLAYKPLAFIYDHFMNVDASLASILYLMNYALFEHYHVLENDFVDHNDSSKNPLIPPLGPSDATDKHLHMCNQISYFYDLLGERDLYPENLLDIYEELNTYDDLGCSPNFINSAQSLRKFSQQALLRRIDKVLKRSQCFVGKRDGELDVTSILLNHKDRILNNEDCDNTKKELINDLINHGSRLSNPIKNDTDRIYFRDCQTLEDSTLTAVRQEESFKDYFCNDRTYYSVSLEHILRAPGQIGVHELAEDIEESTKELMRQERLLVIKKGPRRKNPPNRRAKRISAPTNVEFAPNNSSLSPEDENGLHKALFSDTIDSINLQYMIKDDPRAKGKHLKRLVWPSIE